MCVGSVCVCVCVCVRVCIRKKGNAGSSQGGAPPYHNSIPDVTTVSPHTLEIHPGQAVPLKANAPWERPESHLHLWMHYSTFMKKASFLLNERNDRFLWGIRWVISQHGVFP